MDVAPLASRRWGFVFFGVVGRGCLSFRVLVRLVFGMFGDRGVGASCRAIGERFKLRDADSQALRISRAKVDAGQCLVVQ